MKRVAAVSAGAVLLCAGCGGGSRTPRAVPPPHLPRALAQAWSRDAQAVATALAAGDACTAKKRSQQLRSEVIAAVNAERVPPRFLEPLTSAVNALPERIVCAPPRPAPPGKAKGREHGHEHGKKHGHGKGGAG